MLGDRVLVISRGIMLVASVAVSLHFLAPTRHERPTVHIIALGTRLRHIRYVRPTLATPIALRSGLRMNDPRGTMSAASLVSTVVAAQPSCGGATRLRLNGETARSRFGHAQPESPRSFVLCVENDGVEVRVVQIGRHIDMVRGVDKVIEPDDCGDIVRNPYRHINTLRLVTVVVLEDNRLVAQWFSVAVRAPSFACLLALLSQLTGGQTVKVFAWARVPNNSR